MCCIYWPWNMLGGHSSLCSDSWVIHQPAMVYTDTQRIRNLNNKTREHRFTIHNTCSVNHSLPWWFLESCPTFQTTLFFFFFWCSGLYFLKHRKANKHKKLYFDIAVFGKNRLFYVTQQISHQMSDGTNLNCTPCLDKLRVFYFA